jgi:hypothetical protein
MQRTSICEQAARWQIKQTTKRRADTAWLRIGLYRVRCVVMTDRVIHDHVLERGERVLASLGLLS